MTPRDNGDHDLELSVVIPTRKRLQMLRRCIGSLVEQAEAAEGLELVVVVDGPDPPTERMLRSLRLPFPLRAIVQDRARQAAARNRGVQEAVGRFVLFLDDDIVAERGLVAGHLGALRASDRIAVMGRIDKVLLPGAPRWARARQTAWRKHYDRLAAGREPLFTDCYGGNLSLARAAFLEVGGFAIDLTPEEDIELGYRLQQSGITLVHAADAIAREEDRDTLRHFVADADRRGLVGVMLYRRHAELLPHLRLGGADELPRGWIALRKVALALRAPPRLLAAGARLVATDALAAGWLTFLYSYCYHRGVRRSVDRATWRRLQRGTAILMYHAIGGSREQASRYVLPTVRFRRQLAWLKLRRYNVIGLEEFVRMRIEHRLPPAKSVVLSFDDGYRDIAELALPILQRYGFPATVFVVSAGGSAAGWDRAGETEGRPLLAPAEASTLDGTLAFGGHSRTHPSLPGLELAELAREVEGCKAELEAALGTPVATFAYPYGETSGQVAAAVRKAGYLAACGISPGRNRPVCDLFDLHRFEVRGTDSLLRFALTLWLGDLRTSRRAGKAT